MKAVFRFLLCFFLVSHLFLSAMMEWSVAHSERQGGRQAMEDFSCTHKVDDGWLIGTFDGHSGLYMAEFAQKNLLSCFNETTGTDQKRLVDAIAKIESEGRSHVQKHIMPGASDPGTTAVVAYLKNDGHVHIASVGDSRAIGVHNGEVLCSTIDHTVKAEEDRIKKAGFVISIDEYGMSRVGARSMSRVLGGYGEKKILKSLIAEAGYYLWQFDHEEVLILATDGLFNLLSNEECADCVHTKKNNEVKKILSEQSPQGHLFSSWFGKGDDKVKESIQGQSVFYCEKETVEKSDSKIINYLQSIESASSANQHALYSARCLRDNAYNRTQGGMFGGAISVDNISVIIAQCIAKQSDD